MRRFILASTIAFALLLVVAVPAMAAGGTHTVSMTENQQGSWVEADTNPLTADTIDVHFTGNQVDHVTYLPGRR
jgi:hypothetical protein